MSEVKVNKVSPRSGTNIELGDSGDTVTVSGNVVKTNAIQASDASNIISQSGTTNTIGATGDVIKTAVGTTKLEIQGDGSSEEGKIQLNCHVNSHGVVLQSPPHSSGQSYTIKLPDNQIAADKFIKIKSITGSGSTAVGQAEFADAGGGGMDLLNVTTLGSAAAEIVVDNVFTATYNVYKFYLYNLKTSAGATVIFQLRYGGSSGTNEGSDAYVGRNIYAYQSGISQQRNSQNTGFYLYNGWSDSGSSADYQSTAEMTLFEPFSTERFPALYSDGLIFNNGGGYNEVQNTMRGWFTSKARAKTGFRLYASSGNLDEDTKILTFGMKLS